MPQSVEPRSTFVYMFALTVSFERGNMRQEFPFPFPFGGFLSAFHFHFHSADFYLLSISISIRRISICFPLLKIFALPLASFFLFIFPIGCMTILLKPASAFYLDSFHTRKICEPAIAPFVFMHSVMPSLLFFFRCLKQRERQRRHHQTTSYRRSSTR